MKWSERIHLAALYLGILLGIGCLGLSGKWTFGEVAHACSLGKDCIEWIKWDVFAFAAGAVALTTGTMHLDDFHQDQSWPRLWPWYLF